MKLLLNTLKYLGTFNDEPCIYIDKDGNPSTKNTRHVDAKINTQKEN
jgi:hypothetical protein